ncbi:Ig domain-containing protein [Occallatibacter riparius]|uniref:Ig domain-containing protein n=1 Tax=Occallatibacter riparius TaxID=1002689 RepID=A0A9J7BIL5_9BACT|nr:Ig domain-containing protein [Occallatibacter riparius]UWZ82337.1 Ig domain-containing protein [Occallatibacter riparius]
MSDDGTINDSNIEMMPRLALGLAIYLVLSTVITAYSVYSLWALHSPKKVPAIAQQNAQTQGKGPKTGADASKTDNKGGDAGNAGQTNTKTGAAAQGAASTDKAGGAQNSGAAGGSAASSGAVDTDKPADKTGTQTQDQGKVGPPSVGGDEKYDLIFSWSWLGLGAKEITGESRLLLLVLFMGAFGSAVYSLKSLGDYRGDNKLKRSWALFYIVQPFEGSGIAVLMYLVVRGGFLSGTTTDVNVFGTCAIAGLAGAFSDTAFMKLNEVFNTLFKPQDNRGGKIDGNAGKVDANAGKTDANAGKVGGFAVSTPSPLPDAPVGQPYRAQLKAENGIGNLVWSVIPALPDGLALSATTGVIIGTPKTAQAAKDYTFTVKDSSTPPATAIKTLSLTIH